MKNGKENILNEIATNLLERVGGGAPQDPFANPPQSSIGASGFVNPNGSYGYNVGIAVTISPTPNTNVQIGGNIGGNSNQPVESISGQIGVIW
jgi:hypothetical protein